MATSAHLALPLVCLVFFGAGGLVWVLVWVLEGLG